MDKNVFEILMDNAVNDRLDNILLQDSEYQQVQNKISNLTKQLDKLELTKEQKIIVDRLISSHNESGCCYGRMAYQQGFRDCALLLREMQLIRQKT